MNVTNKINNMLEIPKEVYTKEPKVTIMGFKELVIENYKRIIEYEETYIRLKTFIGIVNINGLKLKLDKMDNENIKILGNINSIYIEEKR